VLAERVDWGNMSNLAVLDMVLPNLQQLKAHRARLSLLIPLHYVRYNALSTRLWPHCCVTWTSSF